MSAIYHSLAPGTGAIDGSDIHLLAGIQNSPQVIEMGVAAGCTTHIVDLGLGLPTVTSAAVRLIPRGRPIQCRLSALLIPYPDPLQALLELLLIHRSSQPPAAQGAADPPDLQSTKSQGKQPQLHIAPVQAVDHGVAAFTRDVKKCVQRAAAAVLCNRTNAKTGPPGG